MTRSFNSKCIFVIYMLTYHFSSESLKTFGIRRLLVVKLTQICVFMSGER